MTADKPMKMNSEMLYQRNESPFGRTWEKWAAKWCE